MMHSFAFPVSGPLGFVGLDAADVMRNAFLQLVNERVGLRPDLAPGSRRSPSGTSAHFFRKQRHEIFADEKKKISEFLALDKRSRGILRRDSAQTFDW